MSPDDFFKASQSAADPWNPAATTRGRLDQELIAKLRSIPLRQFSDVEVALALGGLVNDELMAFGTGGGETLDDGEMQTCIATLTAVTTRLEIPLKIPFRNFTTFKTYWLRNDGYGSWQARREMLDSIFEPFFAELFVREQQSLDALAKPISPRDALGWPQVDEAIRELRRRFETASTPADYKDTGHRSVTVLETLSAVVFDPSHLNEGETELPVDKTKSRIGRYVERTCGGAEHEALRSLVTATVNFTQRVKHGSGNRRDAGMAADSVILLANLLRRLQEPRTGE